MVTTLKLNKFNSQFQTINIKKNMTNTKIQATSALSVDVSKDEAIKIDDYFSGYDTDALEYYDTAIEALEEKVIEYLCEQEQPTTFTIPNELLPPIILKTFTDFCTQFELLLVDFIIAKVKDGNFKQLIFPYLAKHSGVPTLIYPNQKVEITKEKWTKFSPRILEEGFAYYFTTQANNPEISSIRFGLSLIRDEDKTKKPIPVKLVRNWSYLCENLAQSLSNIDKEFLPGKYLLSNIELKDSYITAEISGNRYFIKNGLREAIETCLESNKPVTLICNGVKTFTNQEGQEIEFVELFIEGFERLGDLKALIKSEQERIFQQPFIFPKKGETFIFQGDSGLEFKILALEATKNIKWNKLYYKATLDIRGEKVVVALNNNNLIENITKGKFVEKVQSGDIWLLIESITPNHGDDTKFTVISRLVNRNKTSNLSVLMRKTLK